ncbi:MAG: hypothetical protein ACRD2I_00915, partial [Vicinamibacterales bacterium]
AVRHYSSTDQVFIPNPATSLIPLYWYRPLAALSATAGMHRFMWDVHYQPLDGGGRIGGPTLSMGAIGLNTMASPTTPWVNPGPFSVQLTVNGKTYSQPIVVKADPRVRTPALAMQQVYSLSTSMYYGAIDAQVAAREVQRLRDQIATQRTQATGAVAAALDSLDAKLRAPGSSAPPGLNALTEASAGLVAVMNILQGADVRPTAVQLRAITTARRAADVALAKWRAVKAVDLPALNAKLTAAGRTPLAP